jgi:hypothetical protein
MYRYLLLPPISDARLALSDRGKFEVALKTPDSDRSTHLILEPVTLLERLAAFADSETTIGQDS